ncbi:Antilisterial bacteriocin subtilosin biosynthesis protein AlbA [Luteitalea pratensis]|uniref:Antilisterial bacteriocin subtilosin biosynthesis protein AlbA n=1 Tax=Luteitalea pratensis TaxID=1855912 RepID=A0A143PI94_LUTPR|nr:radical SAM protein [Luteitalea pratensis]AMY08136.1 Antilisterial bacteriocin subtilosin biosynthesis protein AlbA [Luteitalea pratensis]
MTAAGRAPSHALDGWRRTALLGAALLGTTVTRPSAPAKVNFALTYWCQYRCRTCNIWQRKPTDELTTDEVLAFVRENPGITWADLTGGEIFLRPDIETILDAVVQGWRRLALLHFPTNGFLTDRIVSAVERIAGRGPARTIITVSLDGNEALNDSVRGIKGGFRRQIETFRALRRIDGVTTVLGITLSSYNVGRFAETFDACAQEIPGLTADDLHLNVAQVSGHYYDNGGLEGIRPDPADVRRELRVYRQRKGVPRSAQDLLERVYLRYLDRFLTTGRTPMPCHALRASCFVDPWGVVYPCITYSRPLGRLRDTGMRLAPIWNAAETGAVQREIWQGQCPQCWTACEAYQSILGNVLAGRLGAPRDVQTDAAAAPVATERVR